MTAEQVCDRRQPLRIGIASHTRFHMFDLALQMVRLGQQVSLYTAYPKSRLEEPLRPTAATNPLPILLCRALNAISSPAGALRRDARYLRDFGAWVEKKVDGCDIFNALSGIGLPGGRRVQKEGGRWFCNTGSCHFLFHRSIITEEFAIWGVPPPCESPAWALDRVLEEYQEADRIVVPSEFARRTFIAQGVRAEKIAKIPYGVDLSMFRPKPRRDEKFRVLFVGQISIRKGIGYLIEAVRPLVEGKKIELWLAGALLPDSRELLRKYSGLFNYKGVIPRIRLSEIYSQASVLVHPSVQEGLALVQAQAMACGVPVIATPNAGSEDLFSDGVEGFIVPVRDARAIRERVEMLLENPDMQKRMGLAARERVKLMGGWDRHGEENLGIYREILGR